MYTVFNRNISTYTAQQLHGQKVQLAPSLSELNFLPFSPEPLPSLSHTPSTALKQPSSQPQPLLKGTCNYTIILLLIIAKTT